MSRKRTIKLKDLLGTDTSPANVRRVAREMSERLKREPDYVENGTDELSEIVEEMIGIAESSPNDYPDEDWTIDRHFNGLLHMLYDWADAERVWID